MADGQDECDVLSNIEFIQRNVTCAAPRDDQFSVAVLDNAANKWVVFQDLQSADQHVARMARRFRIGNKQEVGEPFEVLQGVRRESQECHADNFLALGRLTDLPFNFASM